MTRENKLALVVGFGLILFIGILISDHFSVARSQASANLTDQQIADPLTARTRNEPDLIALKPPPPAEPAQPVLQPGQPAVNPSEMAAGTPTPNEIMSPEQRSMIDRDATLAMNAPGNASGAPMSADLNQPTNGGSAAGSTPQHVQPVDTLSPAAGTAEITTLTSRESGEVEIEGFVPVKEEVTVKAADVKFHDVRGGESLFAICRDYYGDADLVKSLARYNKMDDPAQVRAGRRLMIPPAEALGGKSKTKPAAKPQTPAKPSADAPTAVALRTVKTDGAAPASSKNSKPKTYTVKEGDSLSGIAQKCLGDRDRWRDLHKLNRKVIGDPDNIKAGTVLRLL